MRRKYKREIWELWEENTREWNMRSKYENMLWDWMWKVWEINMRIWERKNGTRDMRLINGQIWCSNEMMCNEKCEALENTSYRYKRYEKSRLENPWEMC